MNEKIKKIIDDIMELENKLHSELEDSKEQFGYK